MGVGKFMFKAFQKSVGVQFALSTTIVATLGFATVSWFSYRNARDAAERSTNDLAIARLHKAASEADGFIAKYEAAATSIAARQHAVGSQFDPGMQSYLLGMLDTYSDWLFDANIYYEKGNYKKPNNSVYVTRKSYPNHIQVDYDYHDASQAWYAVPKQTGKPFVTEPFFDDGGGNFTMCSVVVPVFTKNHEFVGVAGTDLSLEKFGQTASAINVELPAASEGYKKRQKQIVLSPQNQLIYYPDAQKLPRKGFTGAFAKDVPEGKFIGSEASGYKVATIAGVPSYMYWVTAPKSGWKLAVQVPAADVFAGMTSLRNQAIFSSMLAIAAVVACVAVLTRKVVKPLGEITSAASALSIGDLSYEVTYHSENELGQIAEAFRSVTQYQLQMAEVAQQIADGDLSVAVKPASEQDRLGNSFASMIRNLRVFVGEVGSSSSTLVMASSQLASAAKNMRGSSEAVQHTTKEVAESASTAAHSSQTIAENNQHLASVSEDAYRSVVGLKELIQGILAGSTEQKAALEQTKTSVGAAAGAVTSATESMQKIQGQVENATGKANQLGDKGNRIGAIVQTIEEISEQTNLLALNAAIEAARAGDAGRGFAVVAEEVRKLAERSQSAAKEIALLIESVRHDVTDTVNAMQTSSREVESLNAIAESLNAAVDNVLQNITEVSHITDQNVKQISGVSEAGASVGSSIERVSTIGENTSAGAQEMSAATEEVAAAAQEIAAAIDEQSYMISEVDQAADQIAAMAKSLDDAVSVFHTETNEQASTKLGLAA